MSEPIHPNPWWQHSTGDNRFESPFTPIVPRQLSEPPAKTLKEYLIFAGLYLATFVTMSIAMTSVSAQGTINWFSGLTYSIPLILILTCHEFGHYFLSRRHRMWVTLPYFIPAPTLLGTFGAVIRIKSLIPDRNALFDLGFSGPIAGLVVSLAAILVGLPLSSIVPLQDSGAGMLIFGDSILSKGLTLLLLGPVPAGSDVILHPVALAGWVGLLVTSLNLLPIGQLDGGHIGFALFGKRFKFVAWVFVFALLPMGFLWSGWWVWFALAIFITRVEHPPLIYPDVPLSPGRRILGWLAVLIFVLSFIPVPVKVG